MISLVVLRLDPGSGTSFQSVRADQRAEHECDGRNDEEDQGTRFVAGREGKLDTARKDLREHGGGGAEDGPEPVSGGGQHSKQETDQDEGDTECHAGGGGVQRTAGDQFYQDGTGGDHEEDAEES